MGPEPELDFERLVRWLHEQDIRYLLVGRQAVRLYGSPAFTADYDVWFDPAERERVLGWLEESMGLELSAAPEDRDRPIVSAIGGPDRVDAFFVRSMSNRNQERLEFDEVFACSVVFADPGTQFEIRVPCLDDLIALKKMRPPNPKDDEDIRYLLVRKDLERNGEL